MSTNLSQGLTPPPQTGQQMKMKYVERSEICEAFADSCYRMGVEGFNVKMEFVVNRVEDAQPGVLPTGRQTTSARIVITVPGMLDMYNKLGQLVAFMQAQGILKQLPQMPQFPNNGSVN